MRSGIGRGVRRTAFGASALALAVGAALIGPVAAEEAHGRKRFGRRTIHRVMAASAFDYDNGRTIWITNPTARPLARRDAIRDVPYVRYNSINRHALTPTGWVHEQDNEKIGERDGQRVACVHEDGVNTYDRFNEYPVAEADAYWNDTQTYWAGVRAAWDQAIA